MRIITQEEYRKIWDKLYDEYKFFPHPYDKTKEWLMPKGTIKKYRIKDTGYIWNEKQESLINEILCKVVNEEMYALDWQHTCFAYNPNEWIPVDYHYFDAERNYEVWFPTYYPNGDYYFFVSKDWSVGLYGHPWRKELIVVGDQLICEIDKNRVILSLEEK